MNQVSQPYTLASPTSRHTNQNLPKSMTTPTHDEYSDKSMSTQQHLCVMRATR